MNCILTQPKNKAIISDECVWTKNVSYKNIAPYMSEKIIKIITEYIKDKINNGYEITDDIEAEEYDYPGLCEYFIGCKKDNDIFIKGWAEYYDCSDDEDNFGASSLFNQDDNDF